ncbi:unnamed protein product [Porites evermanni]|uniref:Uncharacterized protein n=1 Tax=Porites evermanni TaxID=104178 RepID=A0ABN8T1D9_9CNID|nr:unnamed protein product [Porites evermanni]
MLLEDAQRNKVEQTEKARLRHKHALEMLQLEEDHKKLMEELGQLERHDRQRRQEAVAKIPVRIFQPPHKRLEDAEERQRDLEQAFEDMYMMQTGYTGDLTVALEPPENLMTAVSEDSATSASDIDRRSVESDEARGAPSAVRPGRRPESGGHGSEPEKEPEEALPRDNVPKAQTEDPLKRLLQRIERQRDQWKRRQLIEEPQPTAAASTDIPRTLPSTKPSSEDQGYRNHSFLHLS